MKKIQEISFLTVGFLSASFAPLYGKTFNYFLLLIILFCVATNWNTFIQNLKSGKNYILLFVIYFVYLSLQTLFTVLDSEIPNKPYYGIFEDILLNFILIPIYVVTLKDWLTPRLLKQFLLLFCVGCITINLYIIYELISTRAIDNVPAAIEFLYASRFGDNKWTLLGGNFFLEPQTLYIAMSALISYFLIFISRHHGMKILCGFMFLLLLLFLSFTVTKAGILAFIVGFTLMNLYIFKQSTLRPRLVMAAMMLILVSGVFMFDSSNSKYEERTEEIIREIENVKNGVYAGGTIAPRIGFIRESFIHFDEFALWGLGVRAKSRVLDWLRNSDADLAVFTNVHNTFIHYWIQGGIFGLAIVLYIFIAPFYRMRKNKQYSFLIISLITIILIMNNTSILLALNNTRLMIILFLSMFYFYSDIFVQLEKMLTTKSPTHVSI